MMKKLKRPIASKSQAKVFAEYLVRVFKPNLDKDASIIIDIMTKFLNQKDPATLINKCMKREVSPVLSKLNKAPGYDLISVKLLRELFDVGLTF